MIQLNDAQSLPQIILRDAASQSGSVLMGDGRVLFSVPSEKYVFSPSMLFADGEVGAWYDPSDDAVLFQGASSGAKSGIGDPVGLVLDKSELGGKSISKFLAGQPEAVTNGAFDTDTNGWTAARDAVLSVSSSAMVIAYGGTDYPQARQAISTVAGKSYMLQVTQISGVQLSAVVGTVAGGNQLGTVAGVGSLTLIFVATSAISYLTLQANSTGPASVAVDNVSVKEFPGNHATQSTSNARPTLQEDAAGNRYLSFDGVDDYLRAPLPAILYQPISCGLAVNFGGGTQFVIDGHGANAMSLASVSGIRLYSSGAGFSAPMSLGENNVVLSRGNGATSAIRVNGSEVSGVIGAGAITAITLGASGSLTLPLSGRIYQAVIVGGVFGGSDRSLESYLSTKSGVVL